MSDDMIKKNISKNISKYREKKEMSQKELAQRLGVVPSRISNWETGANCPTIDILFKVCDVLDVSINDIYGVYPESKFVLEYDEQEMIKKYRVLDERGKEMVKSMLEQAYISRPLEGQTSLFPVDGKLHVFHNGQWEDSESDDILEVKAAHNDSSDPDEREKMLEDLKNLKRPE